MDTSSKVNTPTISQTVKATNKLASLRFDELVGKAIEGQILSNHRYILAVKHPERLYRELQTEAPFTIEFVPIVYLQTSNSRAGSRVSVRRLDNEQVLYFSTALWKDSWYLLYTDIDLCNG